MSQEVSPVMGRLYGVARVCGEAGVTRSSFYVRKQRAQRPQARNSRRGPKTKVSDEALLAVIREYVEDFPFNGEGHRKVWARYTRTAKTALETAGVYPYDSGELAPAGRRRVHMGNVGSRHE